MDCSANQKAKLPLLRLVAKALIAPVSVAADSTKVCGDEALNRVAK